MRKMNIGERYWYEVANEYVDLWRVYKTHGLLGEEAPAWFGMVMDHYCEILTIYMCDHRGFDISVNPEYYAAIHCVMDEKIHNDVESYSVDRDPCAVDKDYTYVMELYKYLESVDVEPTAEEMMNIQGE